MEIVGTLVLFIMFIFFYLIIVEIFVMLFRITGLTDEKARFQVISMLTNSGYTTKEAELISNNRVRRRLAKVVMMFGYAFTVTIVSATVNIFIQFRETMIGGAVALIPTLILVLLAAWYFKKNRLTNKIVEKFIDKIAKIFFEQPHHNRILIVDEYGDLVIARVELRAIPPELDNISLADSNIKANYGIIVLLKKTVTGETVPNADTIFAAPDTLIVLGEEKKIRELFAVDRLANDK